MIKLETKTTVEKTVELDAKGIITLLQKDGYTIPEDAEVFIQTGIDINSKKKISPENPIKVYYTVTTTINGGEVDK